MDTAVGCSGYVRAFKLALSVEGLKPKTISDYVRVCPETIGTTRPQLAASTIGLFRIDWRYRITAYPSGCAIFQLHEEKSTATAFWLLVQHYRLST